MFFDYNDKQSLVSDAGIIVEQNVLKAKDGYGKGACFRNFPLLRIRDLHLLDCTFEDCGKIYFDNCDMVNCRFHRVSGFDATESKFVHCEFSELRGREDSIMELEETEIRKSHFCDIELLDEAYLCESDFESTVEQCDFRDCRTDREDCELFYCLLEEGIIFRRKKEVAITLSCTGLDKVEYIGREDDFEDDDESDTASDHRHTGLTRTIFRMMNTDDDED